MADITKNKHEVEQNIKANVGDNLVEQLRGGLEQAIGFLSEELIKIGTASPRKKIDVNDSNIKQATQTFIYADPNDPKYKGKSGGVLSVTATIKDNEKKIKEWIEKGYDSEIFAKIRKEMQELPDKLAKELSTQKGIDHLIKERVKSNSIFQQLPLFILDNNGIRGTNSVEKNNILNKINQNIEISPNIVSTLLQDRVLLKPLIAQITEFASGFFGKEGVFVENVCVVDEKKLTSKNIAKFTEATNHTIKAFEKIQENLKGASINVTRTQEITQKLLKLDSSYLIENSVKVCTDLKEVNNRGISLWEKFKSIFTGRNYLEERLGKVVDKYVTMNAEFVAKEIDNKIFLNALTNTDIINGITKFINENKDKVANNPEFKDLFSVTGQSIVIESKKVNDINLAKLRNINPIAFDKVVFEDSKQLGSINVKSPKNTPNTSTQNQRTVRSRG